MLVHLVTGLRFLSFLVKKQHLLLNFGRNFFQVPIFSKNGTKNYFWLFFVFFFANLLEGILSFQTHLDSSKNIKNSLFCAILKIFCHPWLGSKKVIFGTYVDFWGWKALKSRLYEATSNQSKQTNFHYFLLRILNHTLLTHIFRVPQRRAVPNQYTYP